MNENQSPEIRSEFKEAYPYLAAEFTREELHSASQSEDVYDADGSLKYSGMSYADAMCILREAKMPHVKITPTRMGGDNFLDS